MTFDGKVCAEVKALGKDLAESAVCEVLERLEGVHAGAFEEALVEVGDGEAECEVNDCAAEDADKYCALNVFLAEDGNADNGGNGHEHGHDACPGSRAEKVEGSKSDTGGGILCDDTCILEAEECDEQADACGDRNLDRCGDGVENELTETGGGQENEDKTVSQNKQECVRVGEAETEAHGVHEECVQTHAGRLSQRQVCHETDEESADDCADSRGDVDRIVGHAGEIREHSGVYHEDVGHCHKGGNACDHLSADGGSALRKLKHFLHFLAPFSLLFCSSKNQKSSPCLFKMHKSFSYFATLTQDYTPVNAVETSLYNCIKSHFSSNNFCRFYALS